MIILLSTFRKQNYIVGVFEDQQAALDYFEKLSDYFEIRAAKLKFPFFILEAFENDTNEFFFFQEFNSKQFVDKLKKYNNCVVYHIDKEYKPICFGVDEMGTLDHQHFEFEENELYVI